MGQREIFEELKAQREKIHNKSLVFADNLERLNLSGEKDIDGFIRYNDCISVKDITPEEAKRQGITMMMVKTNKAVCIDEHFHKNQSQSIFVHKGAIVNLSDEKQFNPGDSFFLNKEIAHRMHYRENTLVTAVWFPNLEEEIC